MPEITIYTNNGDCANGVAEINPFTVGDATDDWTLKFNDGNDFYSPSNVTMRVGHTNGLPDGTYNNAFKWVDRTGAESIASINLANGVPALTFNTDPVGGVVGTDGVYILRGPQLDGAITSIDILEAGELKTNNTTTADLWIDGSYVNFTNNNPSGTSYASAYGNIKLIDTEIQPLVENATWFETSDQRIALNNVISFPGDFKISFKRLGSFFGSLGSIASGREVNGDAVTFFNFNGYDSYSVDFFPDINGSLRSRVILELDNIFLIDEDKEYDWTLERSGSTFDLTVSRNGSIITSATATGGTGTSGTFYVSALGNPLDQPNYTSFSSALTNGILRELKFFNYPNDTLIHYYAGDGYEDPSWADLIGNNNARTTGVEFLGQSFSKYVDSTVLRTGGSGFTVNPLVTWYDELQYFEVYPVFKANGNWAEYELPFMRNESGNDIIAGTTLSPYSDGKITDVTQYDHSTLVIRPETVDTASLTQSGLDWVGTMDPINNYVNARLSLRSSTQLDIQIRGDDRTLFQGQLTILNKIN